MQSTTSSSDVDATAEINWPTENSELVKFLIPREWPGSQKDQSCKITYDASRKLLKIVDDENSILDVINPADVIGCELEIKLSTVDNSSAPNSRKQSENPGADYFDNEPKSLIPVDTQGSVVLTIFAYPKKDLSQSSSWLAWYGFGRSNDGPNPNPPSTTGPFGNRQSRHRRFQVVPSEDLRHINAVVQAIRQVCGIPSVPRKMLVVVNPTSGTGKSKLILNTIVRLMMEQAGVDLEVCETTRPQHAKERAKADDIGEFDAILLMGGDGTIHEFLQGIHQHKEADALLPTIKLGVIGCGTANGLAKSLTYAANEAYSPLESTFMIAKNQVTRMDLSKYKTLDQEYISFLTFTWAMIAEVDIDSEYVRFLGDLRFDLIAVWKVLSRRTYQARLSYLSPSKHDKNIAIGDTMPNLTEPIPDHWDVIDDTFILFWASHVSHAGARVFQSPRSSIHDGVFQILVIRGKWSRYQIAMLLLGIETGTHVNRPAAEFIECVAYRLEPTTAGSYNVLDGERIESGPIQCHVLPGIIQVFCQVDH